MAKWLMFAGAVVFLVGAVMHYAPWILSWFGKLPGDINIRSEHGRIFIPITSMLLVSLIVTVIINLFRRW